MKKKILFGMMAATMAFAPSCQNDLDLAQNAGEAAVVTFSVGTPEIATRSFSDGQTATVLQYAVYDAAGNELKDLTVTDAEIHGSTTVNLQLTTGNTYSVIFWAAAENAPYTVDLNAKTMTVDYTNAVSNDENRDAFYKYHTFTVSGAQTETIELKRPFAQLNVGTNDFTASKKAGYAPAYSYVKVPVSTVLNLVDGTVDQATAVEFALAAIPAGETFPVSGYEYISMNYLLVAADKEVVDVTFGYSENNQTVEKTRTVGSVPVQRNHRTNIYGQLLTSDVDINVEIEPDYDEDDLPETFEEKLNIAAQLGGTVTLTENVELDEPLVVSGVQTRAAAAPVDMVIDLNGKTLSYTSDVAAHSAMITINSGNRLVIKDSKGDGKISYEYTGAGDPNFGWGTYTIDNNGGSLVVEGGTIEVLSGLNDNSVNHMYCAIFQYSGSTVINGGKVYNPNYRSARLWKGELTVNGGEFVGQVWVQSVDDTSDLTINGGTFAPSGADMSSVFVTNNTYNPSLKVTGGTFKTKLGCSDYTKSGVKGSVSGGIFGVAPDANLLAEGLNAVELNGEYHITTADVLATSKEDLPKTEDGSKIDTNFDEDVTLLGDITVSAGETNANSGYGATGVTVADGAVLDGQGNTLTVNDANATWDCVVAAKGGTIKNLTVAGAMRGIFMPSATGDVYIDNVIFKDVIYTFNSDGGNKNYGVYISNSTLNGWTSHSDVHKEVVYTNCNFGEGSGYAYCRPYGPTSFIGCAFEAGFQIGAIGKITFENCTVGGQALTAENLSTLVTSYVENASVK